MTWLTHNFLNCFLSDNDGGVMVKNAAVPPIRAESLLRAFTTGWPVPTDPDWPAEQRDKGNRKDRQRYRCGKESTDRVEGFHGIKGAMRNKKKQEKGMRCTVKMEEGTVEAQQRCNRNHLQASVEIKLIGCRSTSPHNSLYEWLLGIDLVWCLLPIHY